VKKAKSGKTEYYNFTVQTEESTHEGVSFRMDLRKKLETSESNKSPIKLRNIKRKANWKNNTLQDIEINRHTTVEAATNANFLHKKMKKDVAKTITIADVKGKGYDRQVVSVLGYIDVENAAISTMDIKPTSNSKRMDVFINDNSGVILLSIWNDKAELVRKNGVYEIKNAVVRTFQDIIVTTTNETVVMPSPTKIKKIPPPFPLVTKISFPISNVSISPKSFKCPRCNVSVVNEKEYGSDFFHCEKCKATSKFSSLKSTVTATIIFANDTEEVTMYAPQLQQYMMQIKGEASYDDEERILKVMLMDESTKLNVNHRNVVIDFLSEP